MQNNTQSLTQTKSKSLTKTVIKLALLTLVASVVTGGYAAVGSYSAVVGGDIFKITGKPDNAGGGGGKTSGPTLSVSSNNNPLPNPSALRGFRYNSDNTIWWGLPPVTLSTSGGNVLVQNLSVRVIPLNGGELFFPNLEIPSGYNSSYIGNYNAVADTFDFDFSADPMLITQAQDKYLDLRTSAVSNIPAIPSGIGYKLEVVGVVATNSADGSTLSNRNINLSGPGTPFYFFKGLPLTMDNASVGVTGSVVPPVPPIVNEILIDGTDYQDKNLYRFRVFAGFNDNYTLRLGKVAFKLSSAGIGVNPDGFTLVDLSGNHIADQAGSLVDSVGNTYVWFENLPISIPALTDKTFTLKGDIRCCAGPDASLSIVMLGDSAFPVNFPGNFSEVATNNNFVWSDSTEESTWNNSYSTRMVKISADGFTYIPFPSETEPVIFTGSGSLPTVKLYNSHGESPTFEANNYFEFKYVPELAKPYGIDNLTLFVELPSGWLFNKWICCNISSYVGGHVSYPAVGDSGVLEFIFTPPYTTYQWSGVDALWLDADFKTTTLSSNAVVNAYIKYIVDGQEYISNIRSTAFTAGVSQCSNGVQDGTEEGVDCGGECSTACKKGGGGNPNRR